MRKMRIMIFVILIASLLLVGCQAQNNNTEPTAVSEPVATEAADSPEVEQPAAPSQPISSGPATCTVVGSLIPEIPADQIPPVPLASEDDWVMGDVNAEIQIINYSDFQCPYCSIAAPELERFQADYADRVNLVFRHFPLISIHPKAMPAARAAEAAGAQGKFFEMHDVIFENQALWSAETMTLEQFDTWLRDQAEALGLDLKKFDEVYTSADTQAKLDAEYKNVTEVIGLTGTPSVFITINGIPYMGPRDYEGLAGILRLIDLDKNRYSECPPMTIDAKKTYTATITTTKGDVVVELFAEQAPMTVNSFVFLARDGYFNNVAWHRVMPGFVAQAGDPSGSGFGGPGYEFSNEISQLTFDAEGILGMANAGADTNGSQFFITYAAQPTLDGGYTVFGKVIEGMDVVQALNPVDPQQGGKLADSDLILDVQITEK